MIKLIENQEFRRQRDDDSGRVFADMEFRRCRFISCVLSNTRVPSSRSIVRNVKLMDCAIDGGLLGPAILEDVRIHNLKSSDMIHAYGAAFKHVVLSGKFNDMILGPSQASDGLYSIKAIDDANTAFYKTVDWALDIRELACKECDIRGIPADLVRRDPATQAIVRREKALDLRWKSLDLGSLQWSYTIGGMLEDGYADCVLVAGTRCREFGDLVKGIEMLRAEGIAEPD